MRKKIHELIDNVQANMLFKLSKHLLIKKGLWREENNTGDLSQIQKINTLKKEKQKYENIEFLFKKSSSIVNFKDKVVLDFGCGDGIKTSYIAERCRKAIGVDKVSPQISKSQKNISGNLEFRIGFDDNIPLDNNSADIILCLEAWEHVMYPNRILDEFHRVLKPGSYVFFYYAPWYYPTGAHVESFIPLPWCHVFFSEDIILKTLHKINNSTLFNPPEWALDSNGKRKKIFQDNSLTSGWLNMMTEKQFRKMLIISKKMQKFNCLHYELLGFSGSKSKIGKFTRPIRYFPVLREYIGGFIFCALKKV